MNLVEQRRRMMILNALTQLRLDNEIAYTGIKRTGIQIDLLESAVRWEDREAQGEDNPSAKSED